MADSGRRQRGARSPRHPRRRPPAPATQVVTHAEEPSPFFPEAQPSGPLMVKANGSHPRSTSLAASPLAGESPASCRSVDSATEYGQPNQTIIIFDWDDTLCPSTECAYRRGLPLQEPLGDPDLAEALARHSGEVCALLQEAKSLADRVVVITNAQEGWVQESCGSWMPGLVPQLAQCEVVSARSTWEPVGVQSPAGWKAHAFNEAVVGFYSRYSQQSWKNVVSVGDALYEREALARVVGLAPPSRFSDGPACRSKSVKFGDHPTLEELETQVRILREGLREIVQHDGDLDLFFEPGSLVAAAGDERSEA